MKKGKGSICPIDVMYTFSHIMRFLSTYIHSRIQKQNPIQQAYVCHCQKTTQKVI